MKIRYFDWDEHNLSHIERHGVSTDEAEEIFCGKPRFYRSREGRYIAYGKTYQGRLLFVVFLYPGNKTARVITARDMTKAEKKLYKKVT